MKIQIANDLDLCWITWITATGVFRWVYQALGIKGHIIDIDAVWYVRMADLVIYLSMLWTVGSIIFWLKKKLSRQNPRTT